MSLEFRHIAHAYGPVRALEDISFTARTGEITCLLGSSGCGKSTLLNLAAGLLPVQQGSILIDGKVLADPSNNPPPEKRPVGLVFQDGALFPHMTIANNVRFGTAEDAGSVVIDRWLERVGLQGLGERYPHELSGGQQQRAALARAMAPHPQVLLMDEPFASVDIVLRRRLRRDCRMLLRDQGATALVVTHDPHEALDIADRIAVMEAGQIVQFGTPAELRDHPATASVGATFGGAQVVEADRSGDALRTPFGKWHAGSVAGELPDAPSLELLVAADRLDLLKDDKGLRVRDIQPLDDTYRVVLANDEEAEITVETQSRISGDERYSVTPQRASVRAFPRA
ncbi:ABC transporter ATP-binding protein [Erythrobacter sp. THAF29]|uniref:ABC transporter ATP-binding protein n=1 Tax=Erythrobacter sp. THAF29 TaxID=2587851 RepID=UPI0012A91865|nr:ABC transporter ATP-binding protein [Erythrobacter sp. THAF29]QFT78614.1 Fe(3+) ions import ATP-binding protein FbpC [Erythrobacter sp. THAF29]